MVIICADFLKEGFFKDYMHLSALSLLPLFEGTLFSYQLKNFSVCESGELFLECKEETAEKINVNGHRVLKANADQILKKLFLYEKNVAVIVFRNDCYFEAYDKLFPSVDESFTLSDAYPFLVKTTVERVINHLSAKEGFSSLFSRDFGLDFRCDYFKKISNHKAYLSLCSDILSGKTAYRPPFIARDIFTDKLLPNGDFSIIPPVFIKDNVQIESGSVIGPNCVLMDECVIGKNSRVQNSVIMKDVYISSGCFIDGSVVCESAAIKRNGCVFGASLIGKSAILGEDFIVDNGSEFRPFVKTDKTVRSVFGNDFASYENHQFGFSELSPEKAAILGSALGAVFKNKSFGLASDGSSNALCVKLALLSGMLSSGASCFDFGCSYNGKIFFDSLFCNADYSVFISGGETGTSISLYSESFNQISKADYYNVLFSVKQNNFLRVKPSDMKSVKQLKGLNRIYLREISVLFKNTLKYKVKCETDNFFIRKTVDEILSAVGCSDSADELVLSFNSSGTKAFIKYSGESYSHKRLLAAAEYIRKKYSDNGCFYNDFITRLLRFDGVALCFFILSFLNEEERRIDEFFEVLPPFYVLKKKTSSGIKTKEMVECVFQNNSPVFIKNGLIFSTERGKAKITRNYATGELTVSAVSSSLENAEALCEAIEALLGST